MRGAKGGRALILTFLLDNFFKILFSVLFIYAFPYRLWKISGEDSKKSPFPADRRIVNRLHFIFSDFMFLFLIGCTLITILLNYFGIYYTYSSYGN